MAVVALRTVVGVKGENVFMEKIGRLREENEVNQWRKEDGNTHEYLMRGKLELCLILQQYK